MAKIIHIDMDAFFASIEQRDNPNLKGLPVIIAGNINNRSVVSTCSYEARKYGIRSSMSTKVAHNLCPNGVFICPRIEYYKIISDQIKNILLLFTNRIEMFSLDEAYLDITTNKLNISNSFKLAQMIKNKIYKELKLTSSIGISFNKFLAKIGSDYNKPDGITLINVNNFEEILDSLMLNKIYGIGKITLKKLNEIGIYDVKMLKTLTKERLYKLLGIRGITLFNNIRGIDNSEIIMSRIQKSYSVERTLDNDIEISDSKNIINFCSNEISKKLFNNNLYCKTLTLKIKFFDFTEISRQITTDYFIKNYEDVNYIINQLLKYKYNISKKIRLIGLKISNLINNNNITQQLSLF